LAATALVLRATIERGRQQEQVQEQALLIEKATGLSGSRASMEECRILLGSPDMIDHTDLGIVWRYRLRKPLEGQPDNLLSLRFDTASKRLAEVYTLARDFFPPATLTGTPLPDDPSYVSSRGVRPPPTPKGVETPSPAKAPAAPSAIVAPGTLPKAVALLPTPVPPDPISWPVPTLYELAGECKRYTRPVVRILVGVDGGVRRVRFIRSTGCKHSDELLTKYIRTWRFQPGTVAGVPREAEYVVGINIGG